MGILTANILFHLCSECGCIMQTVAALVLSTPAGHPIRKKSQNLEEGESITNNAFFIREGQKASLSSLRICMTDHQLWSTTHNTHHNRFVRPSSMRSTSLLNRNASFFKHKTSQKSGIPCGGPWRSHLCSFHFREVVWPWKGTQRNLDKCTLGPPWTCHQEETRFALEGRSEVVAKWSWKRFTHACQHKRMCCIWLVAWTLRLLESVQ